MWYDFWFEFDEDYSLDIIALINMLKKSTESNYNHLLVDESDGSGAMKIKELNAYLSTLCKNLEETEKGSNMYKSSSLSVNPSMDTGKAPFYVYCLLER